MQTQSAASGGGLKACGQARICATGQVGLSAEQGRVAQIDGLLAVAMTLVIAQHCWLASFGWVGVWLFFVISGYVISGSLFRQSPETTTFAQAYRAFIDEGSSASFRSTFSTFALEPWRYC